MAGFVQKLKGIMLGPGYEDDDLYEDEYEEDDYYEEDDSSHRLKDLSEWSVIRGSGKRDRPQSAPSSYNNYTQSSASSSRTNVVNFSPPTEHELIITNPKSIEDAGSICDDVVTGKICVVNLEGIDRAQAQRIADFLGGVSYALNGDIERISNEIFIIAPSHISIRGAIREDMKSGGALFPNWLSGHFKA